MRIKACRPYQIVHDGKHHTADTGPFDAPDIEAKRWIRIGLAEKAVEDVELKQVRQSDTRDKAVRQSDVQNKAVEPSTKGEGLHHCPDPGCEFVARSPAALGSHRRRHQE